MIEGWKSERLGHCLLGHGTPCRGIEDRPCPYYDSWSGLDI